MDINLPRLTQMDVNALIKSMPYSECGQPMYNQERLEAHSKICGYCKNVIARKGNKS